MNVADGILLRRRWRKHLPDMIEQDGDLPVMLRHLTRQLLVGGCISRSFTNVRMMATFT
jgi:hypothetical protein